MKKAKMGRPVLGDKKRIGIAVTVSRLAHRNFTKLPKGERSRRVSKFLERMDPSLDVREPGDRLLPETHEQKEPPNVSHETDNPQS